MQGRAFLPLANEILASDTEVHRRAAMGRAYYALMLECRHVLFQWGCKIPPRENVHTWVRLHFTYPSHPVLKDIGDVLERLVKWRNRADYDLSSWAEFSSNVKTQVAIDQVTDALALLDAIDADTAQRTAAIAAIRKVFP